MTLTPAGSAVVLRTHSRVGAATATQPLGAADNGVARLSAVPNLR